MQQTTTTGSGKYEALLVRCRDLAPVPTAVAYPCEESALAGPVQAAKYKLIVPKTNARIAGWFTGRFTVPRRA